MLRGNPMLPNGAGFKGMHDNKVEISIWRIRIMAYDVFTTSAFHLYGHSLDLECWKNKLIRKSKVRSTGKSGMLSKCPQAN